MEQNNTVRVFNTFTREYEEVPVTTEIREVFNRTAWNIADNNESYYKHEIQLSALIDGEDENYQNFREFIQLETPESIAVYREMLRILFYELDKLNERDRNMITALIFDHVSEREYSRKTGIPQKAINNRKNSFLCKLLKYPIFKK